VHYISHAAPENFQPVNMHFGILPAITVGSKLSCRDRKERHRVQVREALEQMHEWIELLKM